MEFGIELESWNFRKLEFQILKFKKFRNLKPDFGSKQFMKFQTESTRYLATNSWKPDFSFFSRFSMTPSDHFPSVRKTTSVEEALFHWLYDVFNFIVATTKTRTTWEVAGVRRLKSPMKPRISKYEEIRGSMMYHDDLLRSICDKGCIVMY